jgi:hypothetical protein
LYEPVDVEYVPAKQKLQIAEVVAPGARNRDDVRWQLWFSVKNFC